LDETPAHSTIWEWLTWCSFKYKQRRKRFFVDTHASLLNCKYHKEQTSPYLKRERLKHRWYQMELKDFEKYVKEGLLIPEKGYRYKVKEG
jgi:hypothetical protein